MDISQQLTQIEAHHFTCDAGSLEQAQAWTELKAYLTKPSIASDLAALDRVHQLAIKEFSPSQVDSVVPLITYLREQVISRATDQ
jgi:vacuolar-type H+-ATPase subunit C/Vma6